MEEAEPRSRDVRMRIERVMEERSGCGKSYRWELGRWG
jgi:hypothetical protein